MSGVIGFDPQHTRTVFAVAEGADTGIHTRPVGDGCRYLVPNACGPGPLWGSRAAEARLRALDTEGIELAEQLFCWRCDPLAEPFLRGVYTRLFSYLGHTPPTHRHGYHVCVATRLAAAGLRERCMAAGLANISTVRPTDALVCRWLSDPTAQNLFDGTVVSVACGESDTAVTGYRVDRSEHGVWVEAVPGTDGVTETGTGAVSAELARAVLARCQEGVPIDRLLAVVDSTLEFGASLRTRSSGEELEWDGVYADRLFMPLLLSSGRIARWSSAQAAATAVGTLVSQLPVNGERPVVLVGGIGAIWPFIPDALRNVGPVWQSAAPEYDIAFGAAWWPAMRGRFASAVPLPARGSRSSGPEETNGEGNEPLDPVPMGPPELVEPDDLPPWLRDV